RDLDHGAPPQDVEPALRCGHPPDDAPRDPLRLRERHPDLGVEALPRAPGPLPRRRPDRPASPVGEEVLPRAPGRGGGVTAMKGGRTAATAASLRLAGDPTGWFAIAFARELTPGTVLSRTMMGRELVVYRTESGKIVVMDAHCPHLGAHLGE